MTSEEYDEYVLFVRGCADEELYLESEDQFVQIGDEDGGIQYAVCVEELNRRTRNHGK